MPLSLDQLSELRPPFYRVTIKALIFDSKNRLLLVVNRHGEAEIPGGGIEQGETIEDCVRREVMEEAGVHVTTVSGVLHLQTGESSRNGWPVLRLIVRADISSEDFCPGEDMQEILLVEKAELSSVKFTQKDAKLVPFIQQQWQGALQ